MNITAYLRISTEKQDETSQRQQIAQWEKDTGREIDFFFCDHASGTTPWQKRALAGIVANATPGQTLVVSEISRIARSTVGVLTFLQAAAATGLNVVAIRNGLVLDESMQSKITVTIFALAAEIERDLISERTKAALAARRAAGLPMGRPFGATGRSKLDGKEDEIARCVAAKVSKRAIARMLSCSPQTLYTFMESKKPREAT
jgi:DNA invertase Pin-like site-specific DNA recombinase